MESAESPQVISISLSGQKDRYGGIGMIPQNKTTSLDEPVKDTIKRDLLNIYNKVVNVFTTQGSTDSLEQLQRNWDLWGPLLISLSIASVVTLGSIGNAEELFTNLFVVLWVGPLIISVNCKLLGAKIAIMQSICLIIYCTTPILLVSAIIFVLRLLYYSFVINLILSILAVMFTLRGARYYFQSLVREDRRFLVLYPVLLFYIFLATYISMA